MTRLPEPIERLATLLGRLPGVGDRTALRLAFHVLEQPPEYAQSLAAALQELHGKLRFCVECHHLAAEDRCEVCRDTQRDVGLVCVVEGIADLLAIERTAEYRGRYHVLHGVLSPLRGIGPDQLTIGALLDRVRSGTVHEVVLATNVNVEGEATAAYLQRVLRPLAVRTSRIATGVPQGASLEFLDQATLGRAIVARREVIAP